MFEPARRRPSVLVTLFVLLGFSNLAQALQYGVRFVDRQSITQDRSNCAAIRALGRTDRTCSESPVLFTPTVIGEFAQCIDPFPADSSIADYLAFEFVNSPGSGVTPPYSKASYVVLSQTCARTVSLEAFANGAWHRLGDMGSGSGTRAIGIGCASSVSRAECDALGNWDRITSLRVCGSYSGADCPGGSGTPSGPFPVSIAAVSLGDSPNFQPASGSVRLTRNNPFLRCDGSCNGSVPLNSRFTLEAVPDGNSFFDAWSGCPDPQGTRCEFVAGGSINISARFIPRDSLFTKVSTGRWHTCAISATGKLYCWGRNNWGQVGNRSNIDQSWPVWIDKGDPTYVDIDLGAGHGCGFTTLNAERFTCWGLNFSGQLGVGDRVDRNEPTSVAFSGFKVSIAAGGFHSCLLAGQNLSCWGANDKGQLGIGDLVNQLNPRHVGGSGLAGTWREVAAGNAFTCATGGASGYEGFCWGDNSSGQLGITNLFDVPDLAMAPRALAGNLLFEKLRVGGDHVFTAGYLVWGSNDFGQLGTPAVAPGVKVPLAGNSAYEAYLRTLSAPNVVPTPSAAGNGMTCAATVVGDFANSRTAAYCWGRNDAGQLGNGTYVSSHVAQRVLLPLSAKYQRGAMQTSASDSGRHACAILNRSSTGGNYGGQLVGDLYCWGDNEYGQLGNGTTIGSNVPVQVSSAPPLKSSTWWNAQESGWGLMIFDQGSVLAPAWFTYDVDGEPTWALVTGAARDSTGAYRGDLYRFSGTPYTSPSGGIDGDGQRIGDVSLFYGSESSLSFRYSVGGLTQEKSLTKFPIGSRDLDCRPVPESVRRVSDNFSDVWYGGSQSPGWGLFINHLQNELFAVWYTYDTDREPVFFVVTAQRQGASAFGGNIFRQRNGTPFSQINGQSPSSGADVVGTATFTFDSGTTGAFTHRIGGQTISRRIERLQVGDKTSACH